MENLKALQAEILVIARFFHDFCEKNGIEYFVLGGTALGAERHQGFIPWDDDFDVCMLPQDYDKFLALAESIPDGLYLQRECTREWPLFFSKLRLNDSFYLEKEDVGRLMHNGIYLDIMCLSESYNNGFLHCAQYFLAKVLSASALTSRGYMPTTKIKRLFITLSKLIVSIVGASNILSFVRSQSNPFKKGVYFNHFFGRAKFKNAIIRREYCAPSAECLFEGYTFKCMRHNRLYLRDRFGADFIKLPSQEVINSYPSHCIYFQTQQSLRQ